MVFEQSLLITNPAKIYDPTGLENSIYGDEFRNEYGSIRRLFVRSNYFNDRIGKKDILNLFKEWQNDPEFFILRGVVYDDTEQERIIRKDDEPYYTWELPRDFGYLYRFVKASKRGNDVYKKLVDQRLKPIDEMHDIMFFNEDDVDKRTCALFVTLTYDNKLCSPDTAWQNIGKEFHLFHNNLRKQYGRVEVFRTWEATNHYYPHVHALIIFWDHTFPVLKHINKDSSISWRIPYKEKQKITKYWHSSIDVQALMDTNEGIKELTKYITKDLCSEKGDKTNSMIWFHRKQGYSISKGFVNFMNVILRKDLGFNEPSNFDLINNMCNCNQDFIKWEFMGILRGHDLGFSSDMWVIDLKKPPPRVIEMVLNEYKRWTSRRCDRAEFVNVGQLMNTNPVFQGGVIIEKCQPLHKNTKII